MRDRFIHVLPGRWALIGCLVGVGALMPTAAVADPGILTFTTGASTTQAGAHPDVFTSFELGLGDGVADQFPSSVLVGLPPGLIGNPAAVPKCPQTATGGNGDSLLQNCPLEAQVGVARIRASNTQGGSDAAVFNVESGLGKPGLLAIAGSGLPGIFVAVSARTESDFGIDTLSAEISSLAQLQEVNLTIWGVPGAHVRGGPGLCDEDVEPCSFATPVGELPPDPVDQHKAFMTNPTVCDAPKLTTLAVTYYFDAGIVYDATSEDPTPTNCGAVPFDPSFDLQPSSRRADDATGLEVNLGLPHTTNPAVLGTSHLRFAEVVLPEGTTFNPAAADGLGSCSDAQFGHGSREPAHCPDASKIGRVEFDVPLLDGPLKGSLYLGEPLSTDPQSTRMFRVFQYLEGFGLTVKVPGYAKADPSTGRITAVFGDTDADGKLDPGEDADADGELDPGEDLDGNGRLDIGEGLPQVPFANAKLVFKGGPRGVLATPSDCGVKTTKATFTPWAADPSNPRGRDVTVESSFVVSEDGSGAPCPPSWAFTPSLEAGMSSAQAGGHGQFSFTLTRKDREQELAGLTAELPPGLLATVKGVPLCPGAMAAAGTCPDSTRIGTVTAGSGAGSPFFLPGKVFLTEGYRGAPYGLVVAVPAKAGPFDLGVVVVRQAVQVDPTDAHVKVVSDPLPTIWHGIPLRVRSIGVDVDRQGFMVNPTDCGAKAVKALVTSTRGATAEPSAGFQARGCRALPFKPKLSLKLTGKRQVGEGRHPGLQATLTQRRGEANTKGATIRLPLSLALDPNNAKALCEYEDGLKVGCPANSIIGQAKAVSPLLNRPLTGPVYFVKNVRIDARTGRRIRTLPTLLIPLRGEIAVDLRASSSVKSSKLVSTFPIVPDAPITRFDLTLKGGKGGILAVTTKRGLCRGMHVAETVFQGQNGKRYDRDLRMGTPCRKKKATRRMGRNTKRRNVTSIINRR